jgi:hypothetical protein
MIGSFIIATLITVLGLAYRNNKQQALIETAAEESQSEKLVLITDLTDLIEKLEDEIRIEMLLLQAEGQFTKPTFTNMLNGIKAKFSHKYEMSLKELNDVAAELSDLQTNFKKGKKQ